jgi:hypothetical protein
MHQHKYELSKGSAVPHNLVPLISVLFICGALSNSVLGAERPIPIKVSPSKSVKR